MIDYHKLYDISPLISTETAVFPGDETFKQRIAMQFPQDHLMLSSISTTLHIGAHADSPAHYHADGKTIEERSLERYFGPCQVVELDLPRGERARKLQASISAPRVLFKTNSFPDPNQWVGDFNSLSSELIYQLADAGVVLVGIDTPSVDPSDSKDLESHEALYGTDMAVLEGLVLNEVPEGEYFLMSLPLKIKGADAAPVRAVLLECS